MSLNQRSTRPRQEETKEVLFEEEDKEEEWGNDGFSIKGIVRK
jgi:hypothetical protein